MLNNSIERSIIEFQIALIKVLYKNKKISNIEYSNALKKYEKKLEVYIIDNNSEQNNIVIDIKI